MRALLLLIAGSVVCTTSAQTPKLSEVEALPYVPRQGLTRFVTKCVEAKEEVRIAYLGGSITAAPGWRVKSLEWLQKEFPKTKFKEVNATIGGTGSDLGVYRHVHDALRHDPDLLFVEFCVNDAGASPENIWRGMEGIVRQTWTARPVCDICFVYTFRSGFEKDLLNGQCVRSQAAMELLADHYGIPSVNFGLRCVELLKGGKLVIQAPKDAPPSPSVIVFSNDGVHPTDAGHDVYMEVLRESLNFTEAGNLPEPPDHAARLAKPFIVDHWQDAKLVPLSEKMVSSEWKKLPVDNSFVKNFGQRMDALWEATSPGAELKFTFRGTTARLYDLVGPDGGQVDITVDGVKRGPVARFDKYCTYHRINVLTLADDLPPGEHTVVVTLRPDQPDRSPVTDGEKAKPGFDPKKYDGTGLRVGGILLRGELMP